MIMLCGIIMVDHAEIQYSRLGLTSDLYNCRQSQRSYSETTLLTLTLPTTNPIRKPQL